MKTLLTLSVLLSALGTSSTALSTPPNPGCAAVSAVVAELEKSRPAETVGALAVRRELIDPVKLRLSKSSPIGGIWHGEQPPLDLYHRWIAARPLDAGACAPSLAHRKNTLISQPVVNPAGRQAIVAVRVDTGRMGSHDDLYFLKVVDGKWQIAGQGQLSAS